jgi:16S rRNA G966 N2-methylase RsmD
MEYKNISPGINGTRSEYPKKNIPLKNYYNLKKLIFPPLINGDINQIKIDDESIKYITFHNSAQEITNIIMNNLDDFPCPRSSLLSKWKSLSMVEKIRELVITDMTGGVGGNILNFANYFKYVNAVEIDPTRCQYLQYNVELYSFLNVNYYCNDSTKLLVEEDNLRQDIVFFDPPWGGKDYKNFSKLKLQFGPNGDSIEKICRLLFTKERNQMIVLKLPNNYDFEYLREELSSHRTISFNLDRMTIVIVKK